MKTPRLAASILFALNFSILCSGCATTSYSAVPIRKLQTYSIVAVDDHGILSQSELDKIRETLVQFLIDQGYVHNDEVLILDPVAADTVFRIKIAWPATGGSIAILGVAPSYSGGTVYADSPVSYAAPTPWVYGGASYEPWWYDGWSYDPWWYGDYYGGYSYGPYCPFLTVFPFIPFYGFDHHRRPSPPYVYHRPPPVHRSQSWNRYSHYVPPWHSGGDTRPPLRPPMRPRPESWAGHTSGPSHSPAASRVHPVPDYRIPPSASPAPRPRIPYSDQRRVQDTAMARPQAPSSHDHFVPQDASAQPQRNRDSSRRWAPDSNSSHPPSPASFDRSASARDTSPRNQRTSQSDNRPQPTSAPRRSDSVDHSALTGSPQRQYAAPQRSSPPAQRESSAPRHDYSPPARDHSPSPQREAYSAPARDYSPSPQRESHASPPPASSSSSSNSSGDARSRSNDRDR